MSEKTLVCKQKFDSDGLEGPPWGVSFRSITLGPSGYLLSVLWMVHGAVLLCFFYLYYIVEFSIALLLVLQSLSVVSFCCGFCRYRHSMGGQLYCEDARWLWVDRLGGRSTLVFNSALLWPSLVVLYFRTISGTAHTVVIFSDAVDADELRRLRVLLRL